jgi:hypothetical protein
MRARASFAVLAGVAFAAASSSCVGGSFEPQTLVGSVRVLVARVDKPYARPGDRVTVEVLAEDGRADRSRPMKVYWVPLPCVNPPGDLYYSCFAALNPSAARAPDAGVPELPPFLRPGADITPFLVEGTRYSFDLPKDIVTAHPIVAGADAPYGIAFAFAIACAGRVRITELDPASDNPQSIPIGCTDDEGNALGPSEYVLSFARVYAYDELSNANPVIDGVTLDGKPINPSEGIVVDRCRADAGADACKHDVAVLVPDASWEPRPGAPDGEGRPRHELVYATYYYTRGVGSFDADGKVLFDTFKGRVEPSANQLVPADVPGRGTVWIVVQDNRGGASWVRLPVYVR